MHYGPKAISIKGKCIYVALFL